MKRVVVVGVLLFMFLSTAIAECGYAKDSAEPIAFSVLYNEKNATPFQEDWLILDEYAKRRDVVLDVQLADDEDYGNAIIRTIESGNIPDIVLKVWPGQIEEHGITLSLGG